MSFKQCLDLARNHPHYRKIRTLCGVIARRLPNQRVYKEADLHGAYLEANMSNDYEQVIEYLCKVEILRCEEHRRCNTCNLEVEECSCYSFERENDPNYRVRQIRQYVVIGQLSQLYEAIMHITNNPPYFISYKVSEASTSAKALHESLGSRGFLCEESISTGDEWKRKIESALRAAPVFFALETLSYHQSEFCKVELAYAVAAGKKIMRVLLVDRSKLRLCPSWLDELQYEVYVDSNGNFQLDHKLMEKHLPEPPSLKVRKEGGRCLVNRMSEDEIKSLASKLNLYENIPSSASLEGLRTWFVEQAFRTESMADIFCKNIDLSSQV